ncbi:MAG: FAD-dependent oxidoreductase [Candidatus Delongbacteria bacterium]|nr:FAD-dependent oxidoreductase [Candidatus Delongbacteria bacterium]
MYPEYMMESIKKVEATRAERLELVRKHGKMIYPGMKEDERAEVLDNFHPDYKSDARRKVKVGVDKDLILTTEVADMFESYSRIDIDKFDLSKPDFETDVFVIGGGSAGMSAALVANENGSSVLLATKLRLGDANSMMAQGGIQAADGADDSPAIHYLDIVGGGHFDNKPELVEALVQDAPKSIKWLEDLGVMFDREKDGKITVKSGGGTSRNRMHSARDYTGAAICRVLRDEIYNKADKIKYLEYTAAVELILNEKKEVAGAFLYHL